MNSFSLGAQVGGQIAASASRYEQELRDLFNRWKGRYSNDIREFAFLLRIDGEFHAYTREWNILGAQGAKRKRDWVEVEIGIPETWWKATNGYKQRLADEVERGFTSMIALLRRNRHDIDGELLMEDWRKVKAEFLAPNIQ